MTAVLRLLDVCKSYPGGVEALRGVSLTVTEGEAVAVIGPSGSGKSTLLHVMGTLERPTSGTVEVAGNDTSRLGERAPGAPRGGGVGVGFPQVFLLHRVAPPAHPAAGV